MAKKKSRKTKADKKRNLFLSLTLLLVLIIVLTFAKRGFYHYLSLHTEKKKLQQEVTRLQQEKAELKNEIKRLQDSAYVEKIAREKYGMGRKNEKILDIVPAPEKKK